MIKHLASVPSLQKICYPCINLNQVDSTSIIYILMQSDDTSLAVPSLHYNITHDDFPANSIYATRLVNDELLREINEQIKTNKDMQKQIKTMKQQLPSFLRNQQSTHDKVTKLQKILKGVSRSIIQDQKSIEAEYNQLQGTKQLFIFDWEEEINHKIQLENKKNQLQKAIYNLQDYNLQNSQFLKECINTKKVMKKQLLELKEQQIYTKAEVQMRKKEISQMISTFPHLSQTQAQQAYYNQQLNLFKCLFQRRQTHIEWKHALKSDIEVLSRNIIDVQKKQHERRILEESVKDKEERVVALREEYERIKQEKNKVVNRKNDLQRKYCEYAMNHVAAKYSRIQNRFAGLLGRTTALLKVSNVPNQLPNKK